MDSGATSHMVNSEDNLMKLEYAKTGVTVGDSSALIVTTCGNWRCYWIHDEELHSIPLSNWDVIPGLNASIFSFK